MPYKDLVVRRIKGRYYSRKHYYAHKARCNASTVRSRTRTFEAKARHNANALAYKLRHPDRTKTSQARVDKLPHRVLYRANWRKTHPEAMNIINTRARIKRKLALAVNGGTCTLAQWNARVAYYGGCCAYCGQLLQKQNCEIDHVIPVVDGGAGWPSNLVPSCRSCNARKNNKRWSPTPIWMRNVERWVERYGQAQS